MQIVKTGDEQYRMTLSAAEARIFIAGMRETIRELGDWEYPVRMNAEVEQVENVITSLEAALT